MPIDPNTKASLFDSTGNVADTPVLATNVTPSETPTVLEVTTAVNTSTALDLVVFDGTTEHNVTLNGGSAIGADDLHTEAVPANESLQYNVQYRQDADIRLLQIDERAFEGEN